MKNYSFLLLTLFVGSFCFSQQKTTNNISLPVSIYTSAFKIKKTNTPPSYASIKKNLNFNSPFKFVTISFEDLDNGQFLISDGNLNSKATEFIYDDYKSYRDENLLKGFLQKHDITRWNPCNFRQPNIN